METVSLREFIEQVIGERIEHVNEMLSQRMDHGDTALDLQARELSRRLEELNHAHAKSVEDKAQFLPRETFEAFQNEFKLYRQEVERWRSDMASKISAGDARVAAYLAAVTLGLLALEIIVPVVLKIWIK